MANVHVSGSGNPNLTVGGTSNARISTGNTTMPKYVGARAVVDRVEEGVRITLTDFRGTTQEIIANDVIDAYGRSAVTELSADWLSLTNGGPALTPEAGKVYILMQDTAAYAANQLFRWSGSAYVPLTIAQEQSNWYESDTTSPAYIKNKPTIPSAEVVIAEYGTTSYSDVYDAFDENKSVLCPIIHNGYTEVFPLSVYDSQQQVFVFSKVLGYEEVFLVLDSTDTWSESSSNYADPSQLATVATSGSYSDLSNKPSIHNIPSGGSSGQVLTKSSATDYDVSWTTPSGGGGTSDYTDLTNKPSINSVTLSGNKTTADLSINDIFWATYDTTTSAEIEAAYQAGKMVCVYYSYGVYTLSYRMYNNLHRFSMDMGTNAGYIQCYNDGWSDESFSLAQASNVIPLSQKGANSGVCPLNASGKIDASYLPIYNGGVTP